MRNLKVLLTSGLIIGSCLVFALPAIAANTGSTTNPNAAALTTIKGLRQTDKELGVQLVNLRQSNQAQRKVDRSQKSYDALLKAKTDQISFETDNTTAQAYKLNLEKDTIQLRIDRQAKNQTNIAADLQNVITDLNNQISIRTKLITNAQTILSDLGGSLPATASAPTT
ncbi:MAG: hypothetical protein P4L69_04005 [Desulfosporosinus sp.]|nr:hypothetical protein [Desulfosporosinus sp.]